MIALAETELPRKTQASRPCQVMRTTKARQGFCVHQAQASVEWPPEQSSHPSPSPVPLHSHKNTILTARESSLTYECNYAASPHGLFRRLAQALGDLGVARLPGRVSHHAQRSSGLQSHHTRKWSFQVLKHHWHLSLKAVPPMRTSFHFPNISAFGLI